MNRRSSPRRGREGSQWHRLTSAVQAPASQTTPTQQQNQKKKKENNQINTTYTNKGVKKLNKCEKMGCHDSVKKRKCSFNQNKVQKPNEPKS